MFLIFGGPNRLRQRVLEQQQQLLEQQKRLMEASLARLSNRSLKPDSSISAWNCEPDNESSAKVRGEFFGFFFEISKLFTTVDFN